MTTPGEIIRKRREELNWSQTSLSKNSGVHLNTLRDIEKQGGWSSSKLPMLAEALGLDALSLSKGREVVTQRRGEEAAGIVTIPRYDAVGSMGRGVLLRDQAGIIERLDVSKQWLDMNLRSYTSVDNLYIVAGFGDSMKPMYNSGDPLILDAGVKTVEFDAVYFFRVKDEGFIKRLQRVPGQGLLVLSENQAYRDWPIDPDMDFEVFGRILKVWRSEDF